VNQPADQFTYDAVPTVTAVSPSAGPTSGGTTVTITGTNFVTGATVSVGGIAATGVNVVSPTSITFTAPAGTAGTVDVKVTTPGGTSAAVAVDQFVYLGVPTVTAITPSAGPTAGGTNVTITGTNFFAGAAVAFGGNSASNVNVVSATSITCTSPAGAAGTVDVQVATPGGTSAVGAPDQFTYVALPSVTGISPASGPIGGGTTVTITGTNFVPGSNVSVGGIPATGVNVVSSTSITFTAPAGTAGAVDVQVTTPGGTSPVAAVDQFTYIGGPTVTGVNPASGPTSGGITLVGNQMTVSTVTITGTNFIAGATVSFGGNAASFCVVLSSTQIACAAPAGAAGIVDVQVTTTAGTSAKVAADQYTYVARPTVTGVSPSAGPVAGGSSVTITGTNFVAGATVSFGSAAATGVTVVSATSIACTAPAGTVTVDVRVTTPGGKSAVNQPADQFTYLPAPTVTAVSPPGGTVAGGMTVTITGTNFYVNGSPAVSAVMFGSVPATSFTVTSPTSITAVAPASGSATGSFDVTVVVPSAGTSATNSADLYSYLSPTISNVSPSTVAVAGGTQVTITGQNFTGINTGVLSSVTFAGTPATAITFVSDTQIIATTPPHGPVTGAAVTVTVASVTGSYTGLAYEGGGVTSVSPSSGPISGGTTVTITGGGFTGTTAVSFGNSPAASFVINSDTSITAISPAAAAGPVNVIVTASGFPSSFTSADQFTYYLTFNYNWTTWSSLNWSTPAGSTITWNSQQIPVAVSLNNGFFSWYAPATQISVNPANGSLAGLGWNPTPTATNIAGGSGMDGPFAGVDPAGNNGSIMSGDWKDFTTGQLSYYGSYAPATAWNNPVFWLYYNAAFPGATYPITATTTTITNSSGAQYFLTSDLLPNSPLGRTSYVGNSGMYYFNHDPGNPANMKYSNGPLFQDSQTKIGDITDGSSNTILFGESLGGPDNAVPTYQFTWMGTGIMPSYWDCQTPSQYFMFSSMHPHVVNFAFCDGSVRSITKVPASVPADNVDGPPAASNPATARWVAFQLLAGINDHATADLTLLGLTP
jgi:prepilin-type processing-associated H-X9-DG protein